MQTTYQMALYDVRDAGVAFFESDTPFMVPNVGEIITVHKAYANIEYQVVRREYIMGKSINGERQINLVELRVSEPS